MYRLTSLAAVVALMPACGGKAGSKTAGGAAGAAAADTGSKPLIALIRAADWMGSEWGEDAIKVGSPGIRPRGGPGLQLKISSAQGDLATLPSLIDAAMDAKAKVIVTLQDATLQAAVQRAKTRADRLQPPLGSLRRRRGHQRFQPPRQHHRRLLAGLRRSGADPAGRADPPDRSQGPRIGVLFSPEEQLSVEFKDRMTKAAKKAGLKVSRGAGGQRQRGGGRDPLALRQEGRTRSSSSATRRTPGSPASSRSPRSARSRSSHPRRSR